ncbi:hypothetical protein EVAR_38121_1 [Eumeta japonica]|uniref:Uncharacterized protein n=1 Tax=Eumeta variegata TaxID=151549 RepID=A0A4C1X6J7_EUMVA|nr:hypothetical protein EVAR_38121_1 [Eumeta japonica]
MAVCRFARVRGLRGLALWSFQSIKRHEGHHHGLFARAPRLGRGIRMGVTRSEATADRSCLLDAATSIVRG